MPTVKQVLDICRAEIGYTETGNNLNKFGKNLGENGVSWCALFLLDCLIKAGFTYYKNKITEYDYCPAWYNAFVKQGLEVKVPKPGDIVFYAWTPENVKNKIAYHVGIVESVKPNGDIISIEGNTAPPADTKSNQGEGGGVYRKTRSKKFVVGFGRPLYTIS